MKSYEEAMRKTSSIAHGVCYAVLRNDILEAKRLSDLFLILLDEEGQAFKEEFFGKES